MPKNRLQPQFFSLISLILGFAVSISILIVLYIILRAFGIEERMNAIDREALVSWRRQEFNPKRYFRLFYNISLFFIPFVTIIIVPSIEKFLKKRFPYLSQSLASWVTSMKSRIERYHIGVMIVIVTVVLVDFGYLIQTGIWINYYHHNFIIATINDLFAGKHLLVDTFSQYGMLLPATLYMIFRLGVPFSYMNLYLLFMVFTVVYYCILYFFLNSLTRNKLYSLVGLFFIMGVNTLLNYPVFPDSENYVWPGATVLRYFLDIPVFFLLYKNENLSSKPFFFAASALTAFAILYNIETGIALVAGLGSFVLFFALSKKALSLRGRILFFIKYAGSLPIFFAVFSSLFAFYTYNVAGTWPNWRLFIKFVRLANEGISNIDTSFFGWHIIFMLLYFFSIISVLYRILIQQKTVSWKWLTIGALSVYGLFLLNYYMSRSVFSNLTVVSIPMGIIVTFLLHELTYTKENYLRAVRSVLIITVAVVSMASVGYLVKRVQYRWYAFNYVREAPKHHGNRGFVVVGYIEEGFITAKNLFTSITEIKKLTRGEKRILLFSRYDTAILVMSEKTHMLPLPLLEQIYYQKDLKKYKRMLVTLESKPKYLFVDRSNPLYPPPTSFDGARDLFEVIKPFYRYARTVGILDVYTLNNQKTIE